MTFVKLSGRSGIKWRLLPLIRVAFTAIGRKWVDFYAWMLDRQEKRNSLESILLESERRGRAGKHKGLYDLSATDKHLAFMRAEGLKPNHAVIDFGCGFGRTAIPLMRYLKPGHYTGVEISRERLRIANEYVEHEGLEDKKPDFIRSLDLEMPYAANSSADVIWALTVVSHMPFPDIKRFLASAHRVLKPEGLVLFDYISSEQRDKTSVKDFRYTSDEMESACREAGFHVSQVDLTRDDIPPEWTSSGAIALRLEKNGGAKNR